MLDHTERLGEPNPPPDLPSTLVYFVLLLFLLFSVTSIMFLLPPIAFFLVGGVVHLIYWGVGVVAVGNVWNSRTVDVVVVVVAVVQHFFAFP